MMRKMFAVVSAAIAAAAFVTAAPASAADSGRTVFLASAVEHADGTVTLPLYRGVSQGRPVWYVVLDASTSNAASKYGVNRSNKLANAKGTGAPVRSLEPGMLLYPTGVKEGTMWEVEDEMGNKGWVNSTLMETAK